MNCMRDGLWDLQPSPHRTVIYLWFHILVVGLRLTVWKWESRALVGHIFYTFYLRHLYQCKEIQTTKAVHDTFYNQHIMVVLRSIPIAPPTSTAALTSPTPLSLQWFSLNWPRKITIKFLKQQLKLNTVNIKRT